MRNEEGVFGEYDNEFRIVCSQNYGIAVEYGVIEQALRKVLDKPH